MIQRTAPATILCALLAGMSEAASRPSFEDLVADRKSPNASTRRDAAAELGRRRRREAVTPRAALGRHPEAKARPAVVPPLPRLRDLSAVPAAAPPRSAPE